MEIISSGWVVRGFHCSSRLLVVEGFDGHFIKRFWHTWLRATLSVWPEPGG